LYSSLHQIGPNLASLDFKIKEEHAT